MIMIDEKNNIPEDYIYENGQYVQTDEDKITVPSSRANTGAGVPMQGMRSHRGDTS